MPRLVVFSTGSGRLDARPQRLGTATLCDVVTSVSAWSRERGHGTGLFAHSEPAADRWGNIYNPRDNALIAWGYSNTAERRVPWSGGLEWPYVYYGGPGPYVRQSEADGTRELLVFGGSGVVVDDYELLAFVGGSDDLSGGALSNARPLGRAAAGGRFEDIDVQGMGYNASVVGATESANHSFQFFYDLAVTSAYWNEVVVRAELSTVRE